ncbi:MAG TPA: V-type ATPase subunit [bacterium]|nr:V-type ATPase subunit [bacterium]
MGDFPYINARVKVMKSHLLPQGRLEELLQAADLDTFIQGLTETPYNLELQEALSRFTGLRAVDEALSQNFYHATRRILSFADGPPRRQIEVVLLRYDLQNLRAIVRGRHSGRAEEEILATLYPGGVLSEAKLRELLQQPDLRAIADTLVIWMHPLGRALRAGVDAAQRSGSLVDIELALDRAYAQHGLRVADGEGDGEATFRRFLGAEITATNVKTALKLRRMKELSREERERFFIIGGGLSAAQFLTLADPQSSLAETTGLRLVGVELTGTDNLLEVERAIDRATQRRAAQLSLGDPLALDVVIGYLTRKAAEVSNLRVIAHARLLGLSADVARQELVGA